MPPHPDRTADSWRHLRRHSAACMVCETEFAAFTPEALLSLLQSHLVREHQASVYLTDQGRAAAALPESYWERYVDVLNAAAIPELYEGAAKRQPSTGDGLP